MKRDFLRNFKVGDQELSKEIIDAIMAENGRDIEAAKAPYADYEAIKEQLKTAQDGLKVFEQVDVSELQGKIKALQDDLSKKDSEWQKKVDAMAFDGRLKDAITAAKGKNAKAIAALLDVDTLRASKNQESDIRAALEAVKKDNDYLFDADRPAGYAAGTGSTGHSGKYSPEEAAIRAATPAQDPGGGGRPGIKQADHPVHTVKWHQSQHHAEDGQDNGQRQTLGFPVRIGEQGAHPAVFFRSHSGSLFLFDILMGSYPCFA